MRYKQNRGKIIKHINKFVILLFIQIFLVLNFNVVSAADVTINNNEWTNNDIINFFNGNIVKGFNITNIENVIFSEGNYSNLSFFVRNSINIITEGIVNFIGNNSIVAITVNNVNNVNISGINFNNYSTAIKFNNSNTSKVSNNTITNTINDSKSNGIIFNNSQNVTVENNTINNTNDSYSSYSNGVHLNNSNGNIANNNISGYGQGITLSNSNSSSVKNNYISKNTGTGVTVVNSTNVSIEKNQIIENGRSSQVGDGVAVHRSSDVTISNNNINNNDVYGVVYGSSKNVVINNNNISNNGYYGIYATNSTNNNFTNNNIINSGGGIWLSEQFGIVNNTLIDSNNISNYLYYGVLLEASSKTTISNNNIDNGYIGIRTVDLNNELINIYKNIIRDNEYGIVLTSPANITQNDILNNSLRGIYLYGYSSGSNITSNNIVNNSVGISLYGNVETIKDVNISYNRIYNNTEQLYISDLINNNTANFNWWGNNSPNTNYTGVLIDNWYVLQLSANDFCTIINATKNFTNANVTLVYQLTTNRPVNNDQSLLPHFEVTVTLPNGTVITKDIRNTIINYFVNLNGNQSYIIEALSDDENINLTVIIEDLLQSPEPVPTPEPLIPSDPQKPKIPKIPEAKKNKSTDNTGSALTDNNKSNNNQILANAEVEKTGIPIAIIALIILSIVGLTLKRKR